MKEYTEEEKIKFAEYVINMIYDVPNDKEFGSIVRCAGLELNNKKNPDDKNKIME